MKKRTRLTALLLALCMVSLMTAISASAYTPQYTKCAQALYELGLFKGAGTKADGSPDFALDREATREEALVMLIRLLGEEETALAYIGRHPFTDVPSDHWAYPYVAYGYFKGYTNGLTGSQFGLGQPATANMYLTFVLRALGYDDMNGDFVYAAAYSKAATLGLIDYGAYSDGGAFFRDDCVYISYKALLQPMSNYVQTLGEYLNGKGVINTAEIKPIEQLPEVPVEPVTPVVPTTPTTPEEPVTPTTPVNDGSRKVVNVGSAAELKAAMASNTELHLADGTYTLTWENNWYTDLENVAIIGTGNTKLVIQDGDDTVLGFSNCKGLILSGLILGHDVPSEAGCSSGVLYFSQCTGVQVLSCDIYGCGVTGISTYACDLTVQNSIIRDCSYDIAELSSSTSKFINCTFSGNDYQGYFTPAFLIYQGSVTLDGCTFKDNQNNKLYGNWDDSMTGTWTESNCTYTGNGWQ